MLEMHNTPAPDSLSQPPRESLPPLGVIPSHLWIATRWLLVTVAPAGILLSALILAGQTIAVGLIGCIPALICLCTLWAALSHERLSVALGSGLAQLCWLYLATLTIDLAFEGSPLRGTPGVLAMAEAMFIAPTAIGALTMRYYRWRILRRPTADDVLPPLARRLQFELVEVFAWITCAAVFLALGAALVSRFNVDPVGWGGLGLAIIFIVSAMACVPSGSLSLILAWLILAKRQGRARAIVAAALGILWLALGGMALSRYFSPSDPESLGTIFVISLEIGLPVTAILVTGRLLGWRLVRLPVSTSPQT